MMREILPPPRVAAIVLAAGRSSRFGTDKLRHVLASSNSLLVTTVSLIETLPCPVTLVVNPERYHYARACCAPETAVIVAEEAEQGLSASVRAGISACESFDACMLALADMPFVAAKTLTALIDAASTSSIIVPVYENEDGESRRGNPVVFGRDFYPALCALEGDVGGRELLNTYAAAVRYVSVEDEGILQDIDVPDDIP